MIIVSLRVSNFRSLKDFTLDFEPLTALLGRNGAGKSCVLYALDNFYNISAEITEEDFHNRDTSKPIEISVVYGNLRDDELGEFGTYVSGDKLMVTKRISLENGRISNKYFAAFPQYPKFTGIRAMTGAMDKRNAWNKFVDSEEFPGLERATSAPQVDERMEAFEEDNPGLLEPIEREEQFFGPPNIGGGKLDNYTKFLLIPAVKDVSDEFAQRRGAGLYQLLDVIVHRRIESRQDIVKRRAEIVEQVKELYDPSNLPELQELGSDISQLLERFFPGAELVLDWHDVEAPDLALPTAASRLVEDEFEGDIDKKGHGLQRALLISLLQYLAQLPVGDKEQESEDGSQAEDVNQDSDDDTARPSLILAVEEPELYLHPLRCKYLSKLFDELTKPGDEHSVHRNQIIYSSHSPHFVALQRFENIRILRKVKPDLSAVAESAANSFPVQEAIGQLAAVANLDIAHVTPESFKAHIVPVMSTIANEGFFADVVVLVEGLGDAGMLGMLQDILQKDWLTLGIAIIPIDGKTKLDRPALIFKGLGIPVYIVFDGDKQLKGTDQEANCVQANGLLLRLVGASEEEFPKTQVNETWAAFEQKIETELKAALGEDDFNGFREQVVSELGLERSRQVTKSMYSASRFVEIVYENGGSIPVLEQIVEAATKLAA